MKKIILLLLILTVLFTGCGISSSQSKLTGESSQTSGAAVSENQSTQSSSGSSGAGVSNTSGTAISASDSSEPDVDVDITEKMYVTYINEIYVNTDDYVGKWIRIEGMYHAYTDENTGNTYYYVYRTGPGCCGNDGSMCGFEFTYDGKMPKDNDWIQVIGKLRTYDEDGSTYLTLDAKSVKVMDVRGAETVSQ